jgi:SAM-dependent methyltransferase
MTADLEQPSPPSDAQLFGEARHHDRMFQMIWSFALSQIVHTAARYSFADHLAAGPRTAEQVAAAESLNVDATFRLMRACASMGLLTYDGKSAFAATALLKTLCADDPDSLRGAALLIPASGHWLPWGRLADAIKTGAPQAVAVLGHDAWTHIAQSEEQTAAFAATMKSVSALFNCEASRLIDTQSVRVAVDIGGANGTLIHALMQQNPGLHGIVFDLPHVVGTALDAADELDLADRFTAVAGDFLTVAPPAADLYLLKLILHDWHDEAALKILKHCRQAIKPGGRILIVEQLLGEIGASEAATLMDINMMVVLGGRERQLGEYQALLTAAGFGTASVTPTRTPFVLIETTAV